MRQTTYSSYASSGPKVWLKWLSLIVVFGGFGFLVWYASMNKDTLQSQAAQPELVEPQAGPVKVRAENPGGMEVPNRDKRVFDLLEDPSVKQAGVAENADVVCEAMGGDIVCNEAMPKVTNIKRAEAPAAQPSGEEQLDLAREDIGNIITQLEEKPAEKPVQVAALHAPKPIQEKVKAPAPAPKPAAVETPAPKASTVAPGQWGVQLASFRSEAEAEKGAKKMMAKHSILQNMEKRIQKADVKGSTYYRVQFFTSGGKAAAREVCKALKTAGQGCFNVKS